MITFIRNLLGVYTAVTYQVYNEITQAYDAVIPAGAAGIDWGYLIAGAAFLIMLYCVLKFVGALICKIF